jgi:hypothetical protein
MEIVGSAMNSLFVGAGLSRDIGNVFNHGVEPFLQLR